MSMKALQLLLLCSCTARGQSCTHDAIVGIEGVACVTDYWCTIDCVFNISGEPAERIESDYGVEFKSGDLNPTFCRFARLGKSDSYKISVTYESVPGFYFSSMDSFTIELHNHSHCQHLLDFWPYKNIQPRPPSDVQVNRSLDEFVITWKSGYENHKYLSKQMKYEMSLQRPNGSSSKLFSEVNSTSIPRTPEKPNAEYCVRVKSRPSREYGGAIWSKWSPLTCWRTDGNEESDSRPLHVTLVKILGSTCIAVGFLLFLLYNPATRLKMKSLSQVPSPAPFFRPLFGERAGNLQEWFSSRGSFVLKFPTEDLLVTDNLTIMPSLTKHDMEREPDPRHAPLTLAAPSQDRMSYIDLPEPAVAPEKFPGATSYTQLPFSSGEFGCVEEAADNSLSEDFLDTSHVDSGCGCEELTLSPDCSLPNSPLPTSAKLVLFEASEAITLI